MVGYSRTPITGTQMILGAQLCRLRESDRRIIITGGSSWLGQATLLVLEQIFGDELIHRVRVFGSHARPLLLTSGRILPCESLRDVT